MVTLEEKSIGTLLGVAIGDSLGSQVEFWTAEQIENKYGRVIFLLNDSRFTDDTEMTVALAESIIENGIDPELITNNYVRWFVESRRGYGPSISKSLQFIANGGDWKRAATLIHKEGSYANGGAMRISPIAIACRNATDKQLRYYVTDALVSTHIHPEAIDGAVVQAKAISLVLPTINATATGDLAELIKEEWVESLFNVAKTDIMKSVITKVNKGLSKSEFLDSVCTPNEFGKHFQIRASEAVACALYSVYNNWNNSEQAVIEAVSLGGDTDTVASMTGAIMGAKEGVFSFPSRWLNKIENTPNVGRDYIVSLAKKIATLDIR